MTTIGGLKANRTRVLGHLKTKQTEVEPLLNQRRNVNQANQEQLEELQELLAVLLGHLKPNLQKLETANQKLVDEYVRTQDNRGHDEFQQLLTTEDPFVHDVETSIIQLTTLHLTITSKLERIVRDGQPREEVEGMQEMLHAMAQLTERFTAQQAPAAAIVQ